MKPVPVTIPDLGTADAALCLSAWFVDPGDVVEQGDRLFEVLVSGLTCDVAAPCSGRVTRIVKSLDAPIAAGDVVLWIDTNEPAQTGKTEA